MLKDTRANKLFLLGLTILLALGFAWVRGEIFLGNTYRAKEQIPFTQTDSLNISTTTNSIVLAVDPSLKGATLEIGKLEEKQVRTAKNGSTLSISVSPKKRMWPLNFFGSGSSTLYVTIPTDMLKTLTVNSVSGKITILNALTAEEATIRSTSGKVSTLDLNTNNTITLSSVSSHVDAATLRSNKEINVTSTSGKVEVQAIQGPTITAKSVSGRVSVGLDFSTPTKATVSSTSGSVDVDLLNVKDVTVTSKTTSGSITIDGKAQNEVTIGKGTSTLELKTVSGSISVTL